MYIHAITFRSCNGKRRKSCRYLCIPLSFFFGLWADSLTIPTSDISCIYNRYPCSVEIPGSDLEVYSQRLISLRLSLGETNKIYWWPATASGLRIIGPGVWKMLPVNNSARQRWHDLTIRPEMNGTSCSLVSASLGKNFTCNREVTSSSSMYIQGSDDKGWTPSFWSFGCAEVPRACVNMATNPALANPESVSRATNITTTKVMNVTENPLIT
ncbi:uncharacterized protein LOC122263764 [Penaeus japonicus]|uniref:uncharacterized protein LOC122263764 n=1 Tax=Penaeus japonicus TaxID=27405 RepID=UPI001C716EF2|nr:uncharacterized protein LOC122263764 [Penaeus japonicus]